MLFVQSFISNSHSSDHNKTNTWNGIIKSILSLHLITKILFIIHRHLLLLIANRTSLPNILANDLNKLGLKIDPHWQLSLLFFVAFVIVFHVIQ